ncbi:hypothetical protein [Pluralibacter gergoviae]|uniref:hypothetical protein n=1 Tax=Pluralibacter gergoviae TaxID=61647 RepID=UPI0012D3D5BE|nr:hypothetical protein [Pluralibacter gergoviae]
MTFTQRNQTMCSFSPELKLEAVEQVVKHQLRAVDIGCHSAAQMDTAVQIRASGRNVEWRCLTPEQRKIQSLRAQVKRLEMEKEILKHAAVLMSELPTKFVR